MLARSWRDRAAFLLPAIALLLTTLVALSPSPFESIALYPHSFLLCICVFGIYAPTLIPMVFLFIAGLLADVVYATPFGLHGLCGVLLYVLILKTRESFINAPFLFIWGGMALFVSVMLLIMWLITRYIDGGDVPIGSISWLWFSSVIAYPIWHSVGLRILRLIPAR